MTVLSVIRTFTHSLYRVWGVAVNGYDPDWVEHQETRFEEQIRRLEDVKRRSDGDAPVC